MLIDVYNASIILKCLYAYLLFLTLIMYNISIWIMQNVEPHAMHVVVLS